MPTTSTSAVVTAPRTVETREFDLPTLGDDDGLLAVELAGVCGSDPKAYRGNYRRDALPAILGHEILGRVERLGPAASEAFGVEEGQRVVVEGRRRCGICKYCLAGRYQFCQRGGTYGFRTVDEPPGLWGAHGEYLYLASGTVLHPVDEDAPARAAMLGCAVVGNSVRWIQQGTDEPFGKSLVIQGCGPQALSMTIVAGKLGFSPIVVTGIPGDDSRLDLAGKLGADETICRPPEELVEATREKVGGTADIVVNLTGTPRTAQDSIDLVAIGGTVVYPNVVGDAVSEVRLDELVHKDATLRGVLSRTAEDVRRAIEFIERDPDPFLRLVSHTYGVNEAERAYRVAGGESDESPLKVAIDPIT